MVVKSPVFRTSWIDNENNHHHLQFCNSLGRAKASITFGKKHYGHKAKQFLIETYGILQIVHNERLENNVWKKSENYDCDLQW